MRTGTTTRRSRWAALIGAALLLPAASAWAQGADNCPASLPDTLVCNGFTSGIPAAGFLFEPEVPYISLKHAPIWNELEQMLDNPYAQTNDRFVGPPPIGPLLFGTGTPGNDQGFPSYRSNITRRPGFGVALPQFHVHPLNYNTTTGEEMRLLNSGYAGGSFDVIDFLEQTGPTTYTWQLKAADIAPGADRIEPGSIPIDYNSPIAPDQFVCVSTTETIPPEGSNLCGADPGEPGYALLGFGRLGATPAQQGQQYSTPAVPGVANEGTSIGTGLGAAYVLYDPTPIVNPNGTVGAPRGAILPRDATGAHGLRKPSLRIPEHGGSPTAPNYLANTDPDATIASSENDYIRDRNVAAVLGKALFWDMQVGSDGVQACGSCHFNGTGTDTRTKNQVNPNHLSGDTTLQLGDTDLGIGPGKAANYALKPSDFPLHKLNDVNVAGDPACTTPLVANVSAIPFAGPITGTIGPAYLASQRFSNPPPAGTTQITVCDKNNIQSDVNDVVSSMGVHWGVFKDIALLPSLVTDPVTGVASVKPDRRETAADCATLGAGTDAEAKCLAALSDPILAFRGIAGVNPLTEPGVLNEFRRVEPRNTPTMQAAGFHFDNFWDGRARHDFNGGSVFGAADPQSHVFVDSAGGVLTPTRQIIRFTSIASLATGPGLSEFEMSFLGRNWAKIGKKLLQNGATPLANQLVSTTDSLLGPYSNQGGSACASVPAADRSPGTPAPGKPGLCISYGGLIKAAYFPALWQSQASHLVGCYTDGRTEIHPNQCGTTDPVTGFAYPAASVRVLNHDPALGSVETVITISSDPFDGYVLSPVTGPVDALDTNRFTQMEGNFSLFWGLSIQTWVNLLVPDNTPFDQFLDQNADAFLALGEPGEAGLVQDLLNCTGLPNQRNCFRPVGNFRRDPNVRALLNPLGEGGAGGLLVSTGNTGLRRTGQNAPDPLLGMDIFFASNLSLKNPNFRTARCGECHAIPTLTDHTMPFTSKINLMDAVAEFRSPGVELVLEPLARLRVITGFLLESEINENGQDAVERRIVNQSIVPNPVDGLAYPGATAAGLPGWGAWTGADSAFLDNGIYNLGVRPIHEDVGRGGNDAFGWPLSIATLMMKNLGGEGFNPGGDVAGPNNRFDQPPVPGISIPGSDPGAPLFGFFEESGQDQQINPGYEGEPKNPRLPPYLGAFVNNITVGDFPPEMDEAGGAIGGMVNTLTDVAMIEGFMDTLGPFNPANIAAEVLNFGGFSSVPGDQSNQMGTWPNANRVGRMGSFKAPPLRNVDLTGPYFHNGGKLTLRQVVDFYTRGGDFPITNAAHRDFNLVNMRFEIQSNLSEEEQVALVDFLMELTDERNLMARAPFDHPEVIFAVDGRAPDNAAGRSALLGATCGGAPCFATVNAVGAAGRPGLPADPATLNTGPEPRFMNLTKVRLVGNAARRGVAGNPNPECDYDGSAGTNRVSQYCH